MACNANGPQNLYPKCLGNQYLVSQGAVNGGLMSASIALGTGITDNNRDKDFVDTSNSCSNRTCLTIVHIQPRLIQTDSSGTQRRVLTNHCPESSQRGGCTMALLLQRQRVQSISPSAPCHGSGCMESQTSTHLPGRLTKLHRVF